MIWIHGEKGAFELSANTDELVDGLRKEIAELRRQLDEAQIVFDSTPVIFWYNDRHNRIIRVNKSAAEFERMPVEALQGKTGT